MNSAISAAPDAVVSFESEQLILVDDSDNEIGFDSKGRCHDGDGILHRAFSVFVFNSEGALLMQQRSASKRLWPLYWSNTCCSHPRRGESMELATGRRLMQELGFKCDLEFLYKFQYQATFENLGAENELCSVYIGRSDATVVPNIHEVADCRWLAPEQVDQQLLESPDRFTPWFKMEWAAIRDKI